MLCIFTGTVENATGAAVLYAITLVFENCWPCPLSQLWYNLKQYCFHIVWQKQLFGCADIIYLILPWSYGIKSVNMTSALYFQERKQISDIESIDI